MSAPFDVLQNQASNLSGTNLGAEITADDGSVFRYAKVGGSNIAAGVLVQSPALIADHLTRTLATTFAQGSYTVSVPLGATASAENAYCGGKMVVVDGTGAGSEYGIVTSPYTAISGTIQLTIEQPLTAALDNTSVVSLIPNLYNGIIINPTSATGTLVGSTVTAMTADTYGWIQIKGSAPVLADGAISAGSPVSPSNAVAGAVESVVLAQGIAGRAIEAGVDTKKHTVYLSI